MNSVIFYWCENDRMIYRCPLQVSLRWWSSPSCALWCSSSATCSVTKAPTTQMRPKAAGSRPGSRRTRPSSAPTTQRPSTNQRKSGSSNRKWRDLTGERKRCVGPPPSRHRDGGGPPPRPIRGETDNDLLRRTETLGRHVQRKKNNFFLLVCLFYIHIYKYIQSIRKRGGTITRWNAAIRDCTCILTGLSFFVSCLRVFQESFEYCIWQIIILTGLRDSSDLLPVCCILIWSRKVSCRKTFFCFHATIALNSFSQMTRHLCHIVVI